MCRVPCSNPINHERRIALLGRIIHCRVLVPIVPIRITQSKPIKIVIRNAGHKNLNNIAAVRSCNLGRAIARSDDSGECGWDERECCPYVASNSFEQSRDGGRVAVVEACGNGEHFIGGRGGEGDAEVGAGWVC